MGLLETIYVEAVGKKFSLNQHEGEEYVTELHLLIKDALDNRYIVVLPFPIVYYLSKKVLPEFFDFREQLKKKNEKMKSMLETEDKIAEDAMNEMDKNPSPTLSYQ